MVLKLHIDGAAFRDPKGRIVPLHGINVAGDAKLPLHPDLPSHEPAHFFDGDNVSFVGRPFDAESAPKHFARLRKWGFNTIRYIFTWEAIEAAGPGKYDEEFIQHTISILKIAKSYGFFIIMDPHQDVWSRFTGGCGAPMWTLYACGLDPKKLLVTEAALVQNTWSNPEEFPKMIWATNYYRFACQVAITMFFGGRDFAPKAIIDGVNIQDYLQDHFIGSCKHLAQRIKESDTDFEGFIAWETMNEPNKGLIGVEDITVVPSEQRLRLGTSPTAWQAILTGSGRPCEVETWSFGGMGPYKSGSALIDPRGETAWLTEDYDDTKYGWKRHPQWRLGRCIWAQHNVWEPKSDTLLKKDYFSKDPKNGAEIDYHYFTNHYFMNMYRKHRDAIRSIFPNAIMFCQPPTLELPPTIKGTPDDDQNIVYCPHWYDGVTLMTKKWNRLWNVDVFGVLRGRYLTPAFAIKIGETAIRNCFRDSMSAMQAEGQKYMGNHPFLLGEFGIPFDMNDGEAYKTGDYSSQIMAMDANLYATEGSKSNFTLWNYTATNCHRWGDQWDGEDLSIYSVDDPVLPASSVSPSGLALNERSPSFSESRVSETPGAPPSVRKVPVSGSNHESEPLMQGGSQDNNKTGFRAGEAFVRPCPTAINGEILSFMFDLKKCEFTLKISATGPVGDSPPTEVFLPEYHFPEGYTDVSVSGGNYLVEKDRSELAEIQILRWWHGPGEQELHVTGLTKDQRTALGDDEGAESYLERCKEKGCIVM